MTNQTLTAIALGTASALTLATASTATALETEIGDTTVTLGGYVKFDIIHNFDEDAGDLFFPQSIPVEGATTGRSDEGSADNQTHFHARETRLALTTDTPTAFGGPVRAHVEMDFFGPAGDETFSNANQLRMRHAFVDWNGILAGQYWSNFMPLVALPSTLDFHGPAGYIFVRQAQLRYTFDVGAGNQLAFSAENPQTKVANLDAAGLDGFEGVDRMPDLTAQFSGAMNGFNYALSGVVTRPEVEAGPIDDSTTGFGVMAAGSFTAPATGTRVGGNVGYVDGANRYLLGTGGAIGSATNFTNAFIDGAGNLDTFSELALMGFIEQPLTPQLTGNLVVGYTDTDTDAETVAAGIDQTQALTVYANLQYRPVDNLMYGAEIQWGDRELDNGNSNNVTRLQLSAQYNF